MENTKPKIEVKNVSWSEAITQEITLSNILKGIMCFFLIKIANHLEVVSLLIKP